MPRPPVAARDVALVPLLSLVWGLNWPAVRIGLSEIGPWTLRAFGLTVAALILAALGRMRLGSLSVRRDHWGRLAVSGFLTIAGFNILVAFAQLSAPTARAAIVTFTMPIWTVVLARFVLGEPFDRRRMLGLALGAAGLAALGWPLIAARELSLGLLLALLGGLSWAAGTVALKRWPIEANPLVVATWQVALGAAFTLAGMLVFEGVPRPHALETRTVVALAYHVIFAQALANVMWFTLLARIPAGIAAIGTLMTPAVGVLGAMAVLGEHPSITDWLGLVLIVAGSASVLVPRRARREAGATATPYRQAARPRI